MLNVSLVGCFVEKISYFEINSMLKKSDLCCAQKIPIPIPYVESFVFVSNWIL